MLQQTMIQFLSPKCQGMDGIKNIDIVKSFT